MSGVQCSVPWCTRWHGQGGGRRTHVLELGPFPGPDPAVAWESLPSGIALLQVDENGEPGDPFVSITFTVYGQQRQMELNPSLAADLGDLLTALGGVTHRAFAGALVGLHWLTGGGK